MTVSVDDALERLRQLPIAVDSELLGLFGDELALARAHGLTVYDSAYLEVALRCGAPLATIDKRLTSAARAAGACLE